MLQAFDFIKKHWKYFAVALAMCGSFWLGMSQSETVMKTEKVVDMTLVEEKVTEAKIQLTAEIRKDFETQLSEARRETENVKVNRVVTHVVKRPDGTVEETRTDESTETKKKTKLDKNEDSKNKEVVKETKTEDIKVAEKKEEINKITEKKEESSKSPSRYAVDFSVSKSAKEWISTIPYEKLDYRVGVGLRAIGPLWLTSDYQFKSSSIGVGLRVDF
jgi:preprotein translocase subunit SecD